MASSKKMTMTTKVQPLVSLHPYQANWKIKVLLTAKGSLRFYKNARGEGCVFNVELTDEDGTQMQATMFNEAARKFFDKFEIGKVYYISKGTIKVANKQYTTVDNDYEMTLSQYSQVDEVINESMVVPERKFNFVPLDQLGPYVNQKNLVDVIGVVQHVSPTTSIRRKLDQQIIPKRDITLVDETKKSVVVCLWNHHATSVGQELLDMGDNSPIVAIKSLKVGEFEDVVEEIIGEIFDENDSKEEIEKKIGWIVMRAEGIYDVDANTSIDQLSEDLNLKMPEGLCVRHRDISPKTGESVRVVLEKEEQYTEDQGDRQNQNKKEKNQIFQVERFWRAMQKRLMR